MGKKPDHFPQTEVKLTYDTSGIGVMFQVADRYVRATAPAHQTDVFKDSCVEFFFAPGPDLSNGYFNLEMNCGGTMLFHFQKQPRKDSVVISEKEISQVTAVHSLPRFVDPEVQEPVTWSVAYRIPTVLLERYCEILTPASQVVWRVNFFKCADASSHPHWLAWSPADLLAPDFHQPQSFGTLQFD